MKETEVTRGFIDTLRRIPGCVVWKHNDRITAGIPDLVFIYRGHATWIEVKVVTERRPLQHNMLRKLYLASRGRALYLLFTEETTEFYSPGGFPDGTPLAMLKQSGAYLWATLWLKGTHDTPDRTPISLL